MKRLLDAHGGVVSTFHYEDSGDKAHVETWQDCEPIVERNKLLQNESHSDDLKHIASIPLVIVQKWFEEDGINFLTLPKKEKGAYLRRKLNDPDWRYLRTSGGVF